MLINSSVSIKREQQKSVYTEISDFTMLLCQLDFDTLRFDQTLSLPFVCRLLALLAKPLQTLVTVTSNIGNLWANLNNEKQLCTKSNTRTQWHCQQEDVGNSGFYSAAMQTYA